MITITKITRTCFACPSQWEAEDDQGKRYHIRYRWGDLSIHEIDINDRLSWDPILSRKISTSLDGHMELDELIHVVGDRVIFECSEDP